MNTNLIENDEINAIQKEWNLKGEKYATEINQMMDFGETNGWENWKGKEPKDGRKHLADKVLELLRKANTENKVEEFRKNFPPAHTPFIKYFEEKGQTIEQIHFIEQEKIVFLIGTAYQKRQAYILNDTKVIKLEEQIDAIGKSKKGNVFAIQTGNKIVTTKGWQGKIIAEFLIKENANSEITQLIPFNDGLKILSITSEGIYLMDKLQEKLIHPELDLDDEDLGAYIDMEHATLSNDNQFIAAGDQCSLHSIFTSNGKLIGEIEPYSAYPHFCLFSKDDSQLIMNSCHFYSGVTISVPASELSDLTTEPYEESDTFEVLEDGMRVYCGIAYDDFYILGDAYGYIRAIDKQGNLKWRYFLGSTIGGIAISDNGTILWVASCSGMIHKLRLGKGYRDKHVIGNGNHYEDFRLIFWKDEAVMKW